MSEVDNLSNIVISIEPHNKQAHTSSLSATPEWVVISRDPISVSVLTFSRKCADGREPAASGKLTGSVQNRKQLRFQHWRKTLCKTPGQVVTIPVDDLAFTDGPANFALAKLVG